MRGPEVSMRVAAVYGQGSGQRPVTYVSWRDSIVGCNALSEMLGMILCTRTKEM